MRKTLLLVLTVVLVSGLVGCAPTASADEVKSSEPRETSTSLPANELTELVNGTTMFACDLYRQLREDGTNLFFSPYSISVALAMTYAGARGETAHEMAGAMQFYLPSESLHPAFNYVDQQLSARGEGAQGKDGEGFRLNVVNAIWGQKDYAFLSDYLDVLARNYGAGLRVLDFEGQPEPSRETINRWVEEQTESRIKDLIPQGAIDTMTRLVLTNAVYFNAAWESQFHEDATVDGAFHLIDGGQVTVPMMRQTDSFAYGRGDGFQAIELPYDGGEMSMVIILPDAGQLNELEDSLDAEMLANTIGAVQLTRVALTMPRFAMESSFNLNDALSALGMVSAFAPGVADFSGMDGTRDLYISDVVHKAFVDVDESGTEAAAATAVIVGTTSMPADPLAVTIDRPFLFLIRDIETGTILFLGRVMNPA
ncbi:MAG: serpin family protein [Dehalococcoidia bacterium]|nr:serpin family protein [Dehalococcoidia bacterium]